MENFDGVTAPALPNGWIASNPIPGDGVMWLTTTVNADSPPNCAFLPDQDGISDKVLDRPNVTINTPDATLSFRNNYNTEWSSGVAWDYAILEISSPNIGDNLSINGASCP